MAGIYIHIPFCRKICHYCDFYKTNDFGKKFRLLAAIKNELVERSIELSSEKIDTLYLGGGTPSVLKINELSEIIETVKKHYYLSDNAEITMEANPDDLNDLKLREIKSAGINRLSIGIQSFNDSDLKLMNRRHSSVQAINSVKLAKNEGFNNLSIDLIYGLPDQSMEQWESNVRLAVELDVQHISAYNLTYHEGTVFYDRLKKGYLEELPDELSIKQFRLLIKYLNDAGFEHYEISNFSKPDYYSKHNSSYWKNIQYLGIGPSAHSFNKHSRRWNVSSLEEYLDGIENGKTYFESEILSEQDRYNDYIITALRTKWGVSEKYIYDNFSEKYQVHFNSMNIKYQKMNYLEIESGNMRINNDGLFISDKIISDYMFVDAC